MPWKRKKNSENIAIVHRDERLSFRSLWRRSEALARQMETMCKGRAPVLIYGNKESDIVSVMLAALKTGRAYVPVDVSFPPERLLKIAAATESELLVNFSGLEIAGPFRSLTSRDLWWECEDADFPRDRWVRPEDICYILFTSGSTGEPKGVPIRRSNLENFVSWFTELGRCRQAGPIVLNQVSYSFDVSVIPLYVYLPLGRTLFSVDKGMLEDMKLLFAGLQQSGVAVWISTPSFLELCCYEASFRREQIPGLDTFFLAGEVLQKALVRAVWDRFPGARVINGYGPTEGTVLLSACAIDQAMMDSPRSLPIGRVLPEASYRILDETHRDVPAGQPGELTVVSRSISTGYFRNEEQSRRVFFRADDGRMGYRTGDLVRKADGMLYYLSRKDSQVKLNGYRIEPGDIEENLNRLPGVGKSVVLPVKREGKVAYLAAFVVLSAPTAESKTKTGLRLKQELRQRIPSYMVPRRIQVLDAFPLNTSGKIDRKKLVEGL